MTGGVGNTKAYFDIMVVDLSRSFSGVAGGVVGSISIVGIEIDPIVVDLPLSFFGVTGCISISGIVPSFRISIDQE